MFRSTSTAFTRVDSHYPRIHQLLRRVDSDSHTSPFSATGSHKHVLDLMLFLSLPFPQKREISPARQNILNPLLQGVLVVMETWFP